MIGFLAPNPKMIGSYWVLLAFVGFYRLLSGKEVPLRVSVPQFSRQGDW